MRPRFIQFIKNLKIQNKIIICFFVITSIAASIVGAFSYRYSSQIILEKTVNQAQETIRQLSQNIEHNVTQIRDKLDYLAYNPEVRQELRIPLSGRSAADINVASRTMSKAMVVVYHSAILQDIEIYGNDGQKYYTSCDNKKTLANERQYLETALQKNGRTTIINDEAAGDTIQIVREINDFPAIKSLGVLRAGLKKSVIRDIIQEVSFSSNGNIIVLDAENQLVVGAQNHFSGDAGSLFTLRSGSFEYAIGNNPCLVVYEVSPYTNWKTVGIVSKDVLNNEVRPLQVATMSITAGMLLLCMLLARVLTRLIVSPLNDVVSALRAFSQGDFSIRLPVDRSDEIGKLRDGFNQMIVKIDSLISALYRNELLKKESEFKALQAQINPHFLYNTLDTINWMARKEGMENICDMVSAVSSLMRISISNKHSFITVADELRYVRDYLYIQKVRFRDKVTASIQVDEEIQKQIIPKLILQPVVENAMIHGIEPSKRKGTITLTGGREGDLIHFAVEDTGAGIAPDKIRCILENRSAGDSRHTNLGLYTVNQRIKYMYGESYGLSLESEEGSWTRVTVTIPYQDTPRAEKNQEAGK